MVHRSPYEPCEPERLDEPLPVLQLLTFSCLNVGLIVAAMGFQFSVESGVLLLRFDEFVRFMASH